MMADLRLSRYLYQLNFENTSITDQSINNFEDLSNLMRINLSGTLLDGSCLALLSRSTKLSEVIIEETCITEECYLQWFKSIEGCVSIHTDNGMYLVSKGSIIRHTTK